MKKTGKGRKVNTEDDKRNAKGDEKKGKVMWEEEKRNKDLWNHA